MKLEELRDDLCEIKADVKDIKNKIYTHHGDVNRLQAGHATLWWVLSGLVATTGYILARMLGL